MWIYAKALAESGTKVSIITLQYPFSPEEYTWHGISVYPLNGANRKISQLLLPSKAVNRAKKIHQSDSIDAIHAFWLHRTTEVALKIAKSLRVPLVSTVMGQEMRNPKRRFEKWKTASFPIVSISDFQSAELRKEDINAEAVIPWGLTSALPKEKEVDLICVSSLIPLKNVTYFISLCAQLKASVPEFNALVIGDGPEKENLEQQIVNLGLSSNVTLLGSLRYETTQEWISKSKVLVHASSFEGFGMTIIEAMANATHVLATPVGIAKSLEIPNLIGDVSLDAAMLQMLLKSDLPELNTFRIEDTVASYKAIYESVSREKASGS